MTTRRVARERVGGWPIFTGLALPDNLAALSVEITRSPGQAVEQAVGEASVILGSSLTSLRVTDQLKLWLVVAGAPVKRANRAASYKARNEKVWGVLERRGVSIPPGSRRDRELSLSEDRFHLVGSVELEPGDLPAALAVTRLANAVCLATHPPAGDPLTLLVPGLAPCIGVGPPGLLLAFVNLHPGWTFLARAFGEFDDYLVGAEVFAPEVFLDVLEPVMTAGR